MPPDWVGAFAACAGIAATPIPAAAVIAAISELSDFGFLRGRWRSSAVLGALFGRAIIPPLLPNYAKTHHNINRSCQGCQTCSLIAVGDLANWTGVRCIAQFAQYSEYAKMLPLWAYRLGAVDICSAVRKYDRGSNLRASFRCCLRKRSERSAASPVGMYCDLSRPQP
jgi:hypothetical protein